MDTKLIDLWREWGSSHAETFFQTTEWAELIARHFPMYALSPIGNDRWVMPLMKKARWGGCSDAYYGMPFMTPGGVLSPEALSEKDWIDIRRALRSLGAGAVTVVFPAESKNQPSPGSDLDIIETHAVDLRGGWDAVWKGYTQKGRTAARKAEKLGASFHSDKSEASIRSHWMIISALFREWGLHPCPSEAFIRDAILSWGGRLHRIEYEGETAASVLAFAHGNEVFLWMGGRSKGINLIGGVNLLYSRVIEEACAQGYLRVNLGGSMGLSNLISFKESFGARAIQATVLKMVHPWLRAARTLKGWLR